MGDRFACPIQQDMDEADKNKRIFKAVTTGNLDRGLAIIELMAERAEPLPIHMISEELNIPRSATHRLLNELVQHGYIRQKKQQGEYLLTMKLCSLGLSYLSRIGIVDVAQPILELMASASGELARLGVIDDSHLIWIAKAQGATSGLRYDPDMGHEAKLSCTASGHAWLSCLSDEEAIELVMKQGGLGKTEEDGPNAPRSVSELLEALQEARKRGFSVINEAIVGTAATAAPIRETFSGRVVGVLSVSGPSARFTPERMDRFSPVLLESANRLSSTLPPGFLSGRSITATGL